MFEITWTRHRITYNSNTFDETEKEGLCKKTILHILKLYKGLQLYQLNLIPTDFDYKFINEVTHHLNSVVIEGKKYNSNFTLSIRLLK